MHATCLIIADDFTGACDAGLPFSRRGSETRVWINASQVRMVVPESGRTVVLTTSTRELSPNLAYQQLAGLTAAFPFHHYTCVYKKIDSTLRGNIGQELDALLDHGPFDCALVVPAYPALGRITVGGYHLLHQQLLEDSEISCDPSRPVRHSRPLEILAQQSWRRIAHLDIGCIRGQHIVQQITRLVQEGVSIFTLDSVNESDLAQIVKQAETLPLKLLWSGSAGLANALSQASLPLLSALPTYRNRQVNRPLLIVAGSVSSVTHQQLACLHEAGLAHSQLAPHTLLNASEEVQEHITNACTLLSQGRHLVLSILPPEQSVQPFHEETVRSIVVALAELVAQIVATTTPGGLILTGGETALHVCQHLGIETVDIVNEVEDGLPICRTILAGRELAIVTKAGSFGTRESLLKAIQRLTQAYTDSGKEEL